MFVWVVGGVFGCICWGFWVGKVAFRREKWECKVRLCVGTTNEGRLKLGFDLAAASDFWNGAPLISLLCSSPGGRDLVAQQKGEWPLFHFSK